MAIIVVIGAGLFLVGAILAVAGWRRLTRSRGWPATTATVTSVGSPGRSLDIDTTQSPVVSYEVAGRTVQAPSDAIDNIHSYRPGQQVTVRYDPERPERFVVDLAGQNGALLVVVGVLVAVAGAAVLVLAVRA